MTRTTITSVCLTSLWMDDDLRDDDDGSVNSYHFYSVMNTFVNRLLRPATGSGLARASSYGHHTQRWAHTVRLIALEDLPHGKAYEGDVVRVKAGYARNFLIPQKKAVYATAQNFERLDIIDPEVETEEQRITRLERASSMSKKEEQYLKQADVLKKYLKNKVMKLWRVVDPNTIDALHPGHVNASNIRDKLGKQLKIDLDESDTLHIYSDTPMPHAELDDAKLQALVDEFETVGDCNKEVRRLGDYLAKISLPGGYAVPLKFQVLQRVP
ncbi:unnamed protein product [Cylindrotheca closterium]|uniref:Ribosomal protein L9 domain-containing protein n=1 Tax=Cylindrotheca closterium TaxID=2856 RepID=A0AAD2FDW4_9STRA|nr:unnamed protein product [Cylindrotheca closterium]